MKKCKQVATLKGKKWNFGQRSRVYDTHALSPTLGTSQGGGQEIKIIVASRGRPTGENGKYEQHLEPNTTGCTNTLTSVLKDNYVMEMRKDGMNILIPQATSKGYISCKNGGVANLEYPNSTTRRGRVINNGEISPTLLTKEGICKMEYSRVRKLTPREYWRLMGFTDDDFDKAQAVNSNSQLYKQAGNSIVVQVLEGILTQLLSGTEYETNNV